MKRYIYILLLSAATCLASCENWLDVKPRGEVDADVLFGRESGFKDVLTGAYVNMVSPAMYGREMTFGLVDVLGGAYTNINNPLSTYGEAAKYNYTNSSVEVLIKGIWTRSFNTIANLNHLIKNIDKADRTMFQADNYNVIYGEALGLRAFIHFDILRLFAPSYASDRNAFAIPYVTEYTFNTTPEYTVSAVCDSILLDLGRAAEMLRVSDPLVNGREISLTHDDGYLLNRNFRLNYYAVLSTMARVYLYKGDATRAAACANEVIESGLFTWLPHDAMATDSPTSRDRTFSTEQVFALQSIRLEDNIANVVRSSNVGGNGNLMSITPAYLNILYPMSSDWRKLHLWSEGTTEDALRYSNKLWQLEGMPATFRYRLPLIRLPELYLIAAEAVLETNPERAAELVTTMMLNRGIPEGMLDGADRQAIRETIFMEYRREFVNEGVIFYYYKRLDAAMIENSPAGVFTKAVYLLPMPVEEIEFGQRF